MKKKALCVLLSAMLIAVCGGCSPKTDENLTKITVSEVTHSVFYAPQYIAMDQGYFAEEGLAVELVNGQGADKVMTAVISGQVEIGLAGPESCIYVYNEGRDDYAMAFAQLTKRDGSFIVGRQMEDFSWENMRGKYVIGGRKGGVPEMTLEYVMKKNGLVPNEDLTVDTSVQFALMAGAFTGGTGDYVALFEPTASAVEKEGKGYILASVGAESGEIPYTAYFANKSYLEKNPDVIQSFTNAIYKGQKYVAEHSHREIAEIMVKYFPDTDVSILETVAKRYKDIDSWNQDPVLKESSLNLLQEVMKSAGELEKEAPYDKIVTTEFAEKAMK